ncbi:MAG: hypothetical protein ACT4OK_05830 [Gemmobacter sp.]
MAEPAGNSGQAARPATTYRPEAWLALMSSLQVDFDLLVARLEEGKKLPVQDQIAGLLKIASDTGHARFGQYAVPNEIERLIVGCADGPHLSATAVSQLQKGAANGASGLDALAARIKTAEDGGKTEELRAFVLALTDVVQRRYVARKSERDARSMIAKRLCLWGVGLLCVALLLLLAGFIYSKMVADALPPDVQGPLRPAVSMFQVIGKWHLTALIYFGFFGAFFSRLIAFQMHSGAMTWDDMHRGYRHEVLIVRLMIGGFAALLFYYMIAGNVVGGDAFPDLSVVPPDKPGVFWHDVKVSEAGGPRDTYTIPSATFAKLVVWCFLAGFAERFLPDQLSGLESRAKAT